MKKVRFESPRQVFYNNMEELECHFPRPFIEVTSPRTPPECYDKERVLEYNNDPVQRYECSNSSPYPSVDKIKVPDFNNIQPEWSPSNDLELSMLDGTTGRSVPRERAAVHSTAFNGFQGNLCKENPRILRSVQNNLCVPPNVLTKDDGFFIRRDNIDHSSNFMPLQNRLRKLNLGKENDPFVKQEDKMKYGKSISPEKVICPQPPKTLKDSCRCHHCIKMEQNSQLCCFPQAKALKLCCSNEKIMSPPKPCSCTLKLPCCSHCDRIEPSIPSCSCEVKPPKPLSPQNAVDKKTWAIERYERSKQSDSKDLEKQCNISKEKREPTVADLFKIIKLQNEQLQLLQEKVDKFISSNEAAKNQRQNMTTEQFALTKVNSESSEQQKISIGVMTSFEMVRTETVINQEFVKQANDNSQIQCNRSHISIKEVVFPSQSVNLKFLEGIPPVEKPMPSETLDVKERVDSSLPNVNDDNIDDKTYNEQSLYNLQVENATTPLISPDQSMFLDVKDYSDSDESVIDHSNVGWTYYNKVMTHVNGLLHDSDMPSSASAMYKNTRQQCMQMQIDKTNLSVMKRVKFGDDPLGIHQPHIYAATTDTSIKMNQLAAKYLKPMQLPVTKPAANAADVSIANKKYIERHQLFTGMQTTSPVGELPKFLDITALKQQPKLL